MLLRIATVIAALGVLLHFVLQIALQVILGMRISNPSLTAATAPATRVIGVFDALILSVALLIFFVAFFLSQKPASAPAQ